MSTTKNKSTTTSLVSRINRAKTKPTIKKILVEASKQTMASPKWHRRIARAATGKGVKVVMAAV